MTPALKMALMGSVLLLSGCRKDPPLWDISNLNGNTITVVGHGGMGAGYQYPVNTLASLQAAIKRGAEGIEMDLQLSADSVLILFHHMDLADATSCEGRVDQRLWQELSACSYTDKPFIRPEILDAETFFSGSFPKGLTCVFDLKQSDTSRAYCRRYAAAIVRFIRRHNLQENCLIESPRADLLKMLSEEMPVLKLFLYTDTYLEGLKYADELGLYGITMDMARISRADIEVVHRHGLRVALFNARNEQLNKDAVLMSPDYIQTDRLDHLLELLQK